MNTQRSENGLLTDLYFKIFAPCVDHDLLTRTSTFMRSVSNPHLIADPAMSNQLFRILFIFLVCLTNFVKSKSTASSPATIGVSGAGTNPKPTAQSTKNVFPSYYPIHHIHSPIPAGVYTHLYLWFPQIIPYFHSYGQHAPRQSLLS